MDILEEDEIEQALDSVCKAQLLLKAMQKRIDDELAVLAEWLRILDFRRRYMERNREEDED